MDDASLRQRHGRDGEDSRGKTERGDVIIDGGNSYYKDDIRRGKLVAEQGIDYVDAGQAAAFGVWNEDIA